MIVVADGGSTKCDWIIFDPKDTSRLKIRTRGLNPSMLKRREIEERLSESLQLNDLRHRVNEVYFYGAGCGTRKYASFLNKSFGSFFSNANVIRVSEDLAGAVYSCATGPAVVAILGTGANCCFFDGDGIQVRMPSLGYTLMDDGSGNHLGKLLLRAYYFKQLPPELEDRFKQDHKVKPSRVKKHLYRKAYPNAYLASFAPFVLENRSHPFMQNLLEQALASFIDTHLSFYEQECRKHPVHFIGSVAFCLQDLIRPILEERGMIPGQFIRRPIDGLLDHHLKNG